MVNVNGMIVIAANGYLPPYNYGYQKCLQRKYAWASIQNI